ncbi:MAG: hypothetical protein NTY77_08955 [Elusimicrobia bacterium]|nr:hypothetical protein [Elusimicrobiota bacterium]
MVNHEQQHRRIRNKATAIHIGLIPLALAVPLAWIYLSYGVCQETESPAGLAVCRALRFSPLLPALVGIAAVVFIVWDLARLGAHIKQARTAKWEHAAHGYRALDQRHRHHVHFAALQVVLVSLALVTWLAVMAYRSTH